MLYMYNNCVIKSDTVRKCFMYECKTIYLAIFYFSMPNLYSLNATVTI